MQGLHSFSGKPRGRGRIERLFRTVNDMFLADLPGRIVEGKEISKPALSMEHLATAFAGIPARDLSYTQTWHDR